MNKQTVTDQAVTEDGGKENERTVIQQLDFSNSRELVSLVPKCTSITAPTDVADDDMASKEKNILAVMASENNKGKKVIVPPDPFLKTYKRISIDAALETRNILKRIKRASENSNDISFVKAGSGSQTRTNK